MLNVFGKFEIFAVLYIFINSAQTAGFHDYSSFGDEEKLITQLMKRHSLKVRPTACFKCSGAVIVNITYNVIQILAFSQAEETFSISGWFTLTWQDYRLNWSPKKNGNITQVFLPSEKLWLPDVGVMNGRNNKDFDFSAQSQSRMSVSHDGHVTWMHGVILDVSCPLDVSYFPFDSQTCYIILTPWQSHVKQILMVPVQHGSTVDNSYLPNSNISEWIILYVKFNYKTYVSQINITYQYISISIRVQRQPLYFIILVLVPFSMLSGLACLIFTLDDSGDRLTVALSLVLSMTMYVVIVSSNAPRSMRNLPVLCIYLLNQLGLLSVSTVLAVVNQKLREKYRLSFWQDYQQARTIFNGYYLEDSPLLTDYCTDSPLATLKRAWQSQRHKNTIPETICNSNVEVNLNTAQGYNSYRAKPTAKENNNSKSQPINTKKDNRKHTSKSSLEDEMNKKRKFSYDIYDNNQNHKGNIRQQRHYKKLANKLDRWELAIYLIISLVNAIICLVLMPHYATEE